MGKFPAFPVAMRERADQMDDVDGFLREIWLECSGHISTSTKVGGCRGNLADYIKVQELLKVGKFREYEKIMDEIEGEVSI